MTTIFEKVESAVVADAKIAVDDLEQFFVADVWPIIKSTLIYIENNAGNDLLQIAKNAVLAALAGITSGTSAEAAAAAAVGTALDEAKSAGLQIAEGAATLAVSMAATAVSQGAITPVVTAPTAP